MITLTFTEFQTGIIVGFFALYLIIGIAFYVCTKEEITESWKKVVFFPFRVLFWAILTIDNFKD
jgi:hypothetical protein